MDARHLALAIQADDARRAAMQSEVQAPHPDKEPFLTEGLPQSKSIEAFELEYEIGNEIGRGAFSIVRDAVSRRDQRSWAVKIMLKQRIHTHRTYEQQFRRLRDELRALSTLQHPNVIALHQTAETATELYLLMEKAQGGELFDRIVSRGHFSEPQAIQVMRQLLGVLDFMHQVSQPGGGAVMLTAVLQLLRGAWPLWCRQRGVIHRDIKPENILLTSDTSWDIKVSDFGLVKIMEDEPDQQGDGLPDTPDFEHTDADTLIAQFSRMRATTMCGSSYYMAPEVAWRRHADTYGPLVDVWSSGVVLYILLSGRPPWDQRNIPHPDAQPSAIAFPDDLWHTVSAEAKASITTMLTVDPHLRPTAGAALQMPWFTPQAESSLRRGSRLSSSYQTNMREFTGVSKRAREASSSFQFSSCMSNARERDLSYPNSFTSAMTPDSHIGSVPGPLLGGTSARQTARHVQKMPRRGVEGLHWGAPAADEDPRGGMQESSTPPRGAINVHDDDLLFVAEE